MTFRLQRMVAVVLLGCAVVLPVGAQVAIDRIQFTATTQSIARTETLDNRDEQGDSRDVLVSDLPLTESYATSETAGGFSASGAAENSLNIEETATGFSGSASGMASGMVAVPAEQEVGMVQQRTSVANTIHFTVEGNATVVITGMLNSSGDALGSYSSRCRLTGPDGVVFEIRSKSPPAPDFDIFESAMVDVNQAIGPGTYQLNFNSGTIPAASFGETDLMGTCDYTGTFSVIGMDGGGDPETYFWSTNNGNFDDAENWEPEGVPGMSDTAIFDRDAIYAVTFGDETSGRAIVERGLVTFNGGSYDLSGGDEDNPSLVVGNSSRNLASLSTTLDLSTDHAVIGMDSNTIGLIELDGVIWINSGKLDVGYAGRADLDVTGAGNLVETDSLVLGRMAGSMGTAIFADDNGVESLSAGNVAVGLAGTGILEARDATLAAAEVIVGDTGEGTVAVERGLAETGALSLGVGAGGMGTFDGTGTTADPPQWIAPGLLVGGAGVGDLTFRNGYSMRVEGDIEIARDAGSRGTVTIDGVAENEDAAVLVTFDGALVVGGRGEGTVDVRNGGTVGAKTITIGAEPQGETGGIANVIGMSENGEPSTLNAFENLQIGGIGTNDEQFTGALSLDQGAEAGAMNVAVGLMGGTSYLVVYEGCTLSVQDTIYIGFDDESVDPPVALARARVGVYGLVTADTVNIGTGAFVNGDGEFVAMNFIDVDGTLEPGPEAPANSKGVTDVGVLTLNGDVVMERGAILVDVGGPSSTMTDGLVITGDATIENVDVEFRFVNGYAPAMGDTLAFLEVQGALTLGELRTTFTGLEDGFDFEVTEANGMLVFEALTDGVAIEGAAPGCFGAGTAATNSDVSGTLFVFALAIAAVWCRPGRSRLAD